MEKFNLSKTLGLIKGGLIDHQATWNAYFQDCPGWQTTAINLTAPLLLANVLIGAILGQIFGGFSAYGYYDNVFSALFFGLIIACIGFTVAVFVFSTMAGVFQGKSDFSRSFAAVSLAAIPSWLAGMVAAILPGFFGSLLSLAGGVLSLVFMYRLMPLALAIPDAKKTVHFISSLVIILIVNIVVGSLLPISHSTGFGSEGFSTSNSSSESSPGAGLFGQIERQARLMDSATSDQFDPPENGEVSKSQVLALIKVIEKAHVIRVEYEQKMEKVAREMDAKQESGDSPSLADFNQLYSGMGNAFSAGNAEMEIVKTGDGNWAEYSWVKEQLRIANLHRGDGSPAVEHNYKLYAEFADQLGDL
ncbi:MAG: YIP1 family protein [Proteobacteria bacterium]|nr:YIP1 family protein [Pseudomonadota bacterium]